MQGTRRLLRKEGNLKKYDGLFILLWHNSSLDKLELPGWIKTYERTMEYLGEQNIFDETALGIIDWWQSNVFGCSTY